MGKSITRRTVVKHGLMAGTAISALGPIGSGPSGAADLPPLDPKDPAAVTLGFVNDSTHVDVSANPMYAHGQTCVTCQQYQGKPADARGGCILFPGKSVPAAGWCKVWRKIF
jgi:hypothetical protein